MGICSEFIEKNKEAVKKLAILGLVYGIIAVLYSFIKGGQINLNVLFLVVSMFILVVSLKSNSINRNKNE